MHKTAIILALPALLALAACADSEPDTDNAADDFAARINGGDTAGTPLPEATATPTIAEPLENAAQGAFAPGTATDPESATCAANAMGPFIGQPADDPTRAAIMTAAAGAREVRFVPAGSAYIKPDPTSPRLNIMIDNIGVIRDARCG
jgi:hypothetical protein